MTRLPFILLLLGPLAAVFLTLATRLNCALSTIWPALFFAVILPNVFYSFFLPRLGFSAEELLSWGKRLKLCHCALYPLRPMLMIFDPMLPYCPLYLFSLLLPDLLYELIGILMARQSGRLTKAQALVNIPLQFIPVLDAFSAIYCHDQIRRVNRPKHMNHTKLARNA